MRSSGATPATSSGAPVAYVLAIDVGGTFTDLVLTDQHNGSHVVSKTPSTPADPAVGVLEGIRRVMARAGASADDLSALRLGTTAGVNALLTRRGARVGLLVTEGFREILHLARSQTPGPLVGWLNMDKPEPLADLELTIEVPERCRADGTVERPIDEAAARSAITALVEAGVDAVAVVFLHSYANPENERRGRELAHDIAPRLAVSLSSDVLPEYREYERAATTVANAFVMPAVSHALAELEGRLTADGWRPAISVVRSDGGLMSAHAAVERPVSTIFSGPSGGVAGALALACQSGFSNVLTLDMGGTSTDVSVCIDGQVAVARETVVGDFPLRVPSVDVRSIGAGGGSIASVPETIRALRVGPQSAGAQPGPACYGRGGVEPTVTDANLLLGRLPDELLGGEMRLDRTRAAEAIASLAAQVGLEKVEAAQGIVDIVDESMAGALRLISVERGLDPRRFALVAFGGAGPLHANALAALLGCFPVIVPPSAGVLSAYGFQTVGHRATFTRTMIRELSPASLTEIRAAFAQLAAEANAWLERERVDGAALAYSCDLRFLRQGYELEIGFPESQLAARWDATIVERLCADHRRLYGFVPDAPAEVVNLRIEARGPATVRLPEPTPVTPGNGEHARVGMTEMYAEPGPLRAGIFARNELQAGDRLSGPAVITEDDATTLVLPGHRATVDAHLNLLLEADEGL